MKELCPDHNILPNFNKDDRKVISKIFHATGASSEKLPFDWWKCLA
ncbi:MAG: hypothetical protein ACOH2A_15945 [Sphingobacteriaceae bacterium]